MGIDVESYYARPLEEDVPPSREALAAAMAQLGTETQQETKPSLRDF